MKFKFGLLPRVVLAIALGVACGFFLPGWATRIALTFNAIFGQFLGFAIPLLILGLVAPGIGRGGFSFRRCSKAPPPYCPRKGRPLRPISRSKCLP